MVNYDNYSSVGLLGCDTTVYSCGRIPTFRRPCRLQLDFTLKVEVAWSTPLHGVTTQKTATLTFKAVETSSLHDKN